MTEPVLQVRNLTTAMHVANSTVNVVDGISFDLKRGQTLALLGESGCGKSITALSIMRVLPQPPMLDPVGEVIYKGKNLLTCSSSQMRKVRGAGIGMIFQNPGAALNPVYTIGDQFLEVLDLHLGIVGTEAIERCLKVLREVGIPAPEQRLYDYPHQLSGGMKQRMMIAMALLCEPDVLIADEPTTALDVTIQAQVLDIMQQLQKSRGMAILLITHDMGVVAEMADEVTVMYASRAIETGSVNAIFDNMSHPYTQALFQSLPRRDSPRGELPAIAGTVPPLNNYPDGCRFSPRCPHAMDVCRTGDVPGFVTGVGQMAHCWLHRDREEVK